MATMNVSLPDELKTYVDARVEAGAYQSSSEFVRELIRKDQDGQHLRGLIEQGMRSPLEGAPDDAFFGSLRERAGRKRA